MRAQGLDKAAVADETNKSHQQNVALNQIACAIAELTMQTKALESLSLDSQTPEDYVVRTELYEIRLALKGLTNSHRRLSAVLFG